MDLIKINKTEDGKQAVSARELYQKLGYDKSQYSRWSKKHILENSFAVEGQDYEGFDVNVGGNISRDFALSLDFAKKLCMISKTKIGEVFRDYFIECEKKLKETVYQIPNTYSEALKLAYEQTLEIEKQALLIESQKPLVNFAEALQISENCISIGGLAKILKQNGIDIGQNRLFEYLRNEDYLMSRGEQKNLPTQRSLELKLFQVKTTTTNNLDGSIRVNKTTMVTPKGQKYFVNRFLKPNNNRQIFKRNDKNLFTS